MKKIIYLLVVCFSILNTYAQNLVINGNFEQRNTSCGINGVPNGISQLCCASSWTAMNFWNTNTPSTPDLFDGNSTSTNVDFSNVWGTITDRFNATNGFTRYAGIFGTDATYNEGVQGVLTQRLPQGCYTFSIDVAGADPARFPAFPSPGSINLNLCSLVVELYNSTNVNQVRTIFNGQTPHPVAAVNWSTFTQQFFINLASANIYDRIRIRLNVSPNGRCPVYLDNVTINLTPVAPIISGPSSVCLGSSATLTVAPTGANFSYVWSPGSYTTSSITVTPTVTTTYTCTVTTPAGCSGTTTKKIIVSPKPIADAGPERMKLCSNPVSGTAPPLYLGTGPAISGYTYSWAPVTSNAPLSCYNCPQPQVGPINLVSPNNPMTHFTLTVTNNFGCTATDVTYITSTWQKYDPPTHNNLWGEAGNTVYFCPNQQITIGTAGSIPNLSFSWYPAVNSPTSQQTTVSPTTSTTYVLYSIETLTACWASDMVLASCNCCKTGDHLSTDEPVLASNNFTLFPNPNSGQFSLKYSLETDASGKVVIYDINGKRISEYILDSGNYNTLYINENNLSEGLYFYQIVINNDIVKSEKFSVIK